MLGKTNFFSWDTFEDGEFSVGSSEKLQKAEMPVCFDSVDTSFTVTVGTYLLQRKEAAINPVYRELYREEKITVESWDTEKSISQVTVEIKFKR